MIPIASSVPIRIASGHTDMRKGMQGLSLLVQEGLGRDPVAGDWRGPVRFRAKKSALANGRRPRKDDPPLLSHGSENAFELSNRKIEFSKLGTFRSPPTRPSGAFAKITQVDGLNANSRRCR